MISCSGVRARYRGVIRRTIHRFEYRSTKNARPNASPSTNLVRSTVQKTSDRCTSRNHRTSTKKPDSAVKASTRPATTATRMMINRRRPGAGVAVGTRTTMGPVLPYGSAGERGKPIIGPCRARVRSCALQVRERLVERRYRHELEAVVPARTGGPQVALWDQEDRRPRVRRGGHLLLNPVDRAHRAVQR